MTVKNKYALLHIMSQAKIFVMRNESLVTQYKNLYEVHIYTHGATK
jgi:hypothetical protein